MSSPALTRALTSHSLQAALFFAVCFAALAAAARSGAAPADPPRPNVVLIMADDMGYSDVGCYGSEIPTPNIDRLAREGVRFSDFYVTPRCSPTRATLLTGLYNHEAGLGEVPEYGRQVGGPGYLSHLSDRAVTIAEVLREAGYSTYLSGKWHLGRERPHWPVDRGFDRSEALIDCCSNFFGDPHASETRKLVSMRERYAIDGELWRPPAEGFYSTDWFGANAARMIREQPAGTPFFLYLSFTAPHWPLQAPEAEIEAHRGRYREGWQAVRERRFERQKELGLISRHLTLPPPDGPVPDWHSLSSEQQDQFDLRMAIYAAMIAIMDRNIGAVLDALEQKGVARDTLVLFLSDNGATQENPNRGRPGAPLGSRESYHGYGIGWASASNTPFRLYKHWVHEGGISTPLIARWPRGVTEPGRIYRHPAHAIDIMATLVELCGATYPSTYRDRPILPLRGISLAPAFRGAELVRDEPLFWEHQGNAAVRDGCWKLVRREDGDGDWELYDLAADRTEQRNLAKQEPERVRRMEQQFLAWAHRSFVAWPWPLKPYRLR